MKFIDLLVEKSLFVSSKFTATVTSLHELAQAVHQLALNLQRVTNMVVYHEKVLQQMFLEQQDALRTFKEESPDLALPPTKPDKVEKPN